MGFYNKIEVTPDLLKNFLPKDVNLCYQKSGKWSSGIDKPDIYISRTPEHGWLIHRRKCGKEPSIDLIYAQLRTSRTIEDSPLPPFGSNKWIQPRFYDSKSYKWIPSNLRLDHLFVEECKECGTKRKDKELVCHNVKCKQPDSWIPSGDAFCRF